MATRCGSFTVPPDGSCQRVEDASPWQQCYADVHSCHVPSTGLPAAEEPPVLRRTLRADTASPAPAGADTTPRP
jgi:hypothetical protein